MSNLVDRRVPVNGKPVTLPSRSQDHGTEAGCRSTDTGRCRKARGHVQPYGGEARALRGVPQTNRSRPRTGRGSVRTLRGVAHLWRCRDGRFAQQPERCK